MEAVVFDLDGTLCAYRRRGGEVLAEAFERAGVEPVFGVEDYYGVYERYAGVAESVERQRAACFADLAERAGRSAAEGRAVAEAYAELRDHADVEFTPGAPDALEALQADHRLGLVTNGAPGMQSTKLEALGLADVFEAVVHGGHDAPAKPAPEPFHRALSALGATPERAVHVGNSLEADVAGAAAAGLRSAYLETDGPAGDEADAGARPDYVLGSLAELVEPPWADGA